MMMPETDGRDPLDAAFSAPKSGDAVAPGQIAALLGEDDPARPLPQELVPAAVPEANTDVTVPDPNDVLSAQLDAAFSEPKTGELLNFNREPDVSGPPAAFRPLAPADTVPEAADPLGVTFGKVGTQPEKPVGRSMTMVLILLVVMGLIFASTQLNVFSLLSV